MNLIFATPPSDCNHNVEMPLHHETVCPCALSLNTTTPTGSRYVWTWQLQNKVGYDGCVLRLVVTPRATAVTGDWHS